MSSSLIREPQPRPGAVLLSTLYPFLSSKALSFLNLENPAFKSDYGNLPVSNQIRELANMLIYCLDFYASFIESVILSDEIYLWTFPGVYNKDWKDWPKEISSLLNPVPESLWHIGSEKTLNQIKAEQNDMRRICVEFSPGDSFEIILPSEHSTPAEVAAHLGVIWYPTYLRGYLHQLASVIPTNRSVTVFALSKLQDARNRRKTSLPFWPPGAWDIDMPALFSAVVAEASSFIDMFVIASQMRNTKGAKAFRQWCYEVDNEENLLKFDKHIKEIRGLAKELATGVGQENLNTHFSFGVTPVSVALPARIPKWLSKPLHKKSRHLSFLKKVFEKSLSYRGISEKLSRILEVDREIVELGTARFMLVSKKLEKLL